MVICQGEMCQVAKLDMKREKEREKIREERVGVGVGMREEWRSIG